MLVLPKIPVHTSEPRSATATDIRIALYAAFETGTLGFAVDDEARGILDAYAAKVANQSEVARHWSELEKGMSIKARYIGRAAAKNAFREGRRNVNPEDARLGLNGAYEIAESPFCPIPVDGNSSIKNLK